MFYSNLSSAFKNAAAADKSDAPLLFKVRNYKPANQGFAVLLPVDQLISNQ